MANSVGLNSGEGFSSDEERASAEVDNNNGVIGKFSASTGAIINASFVSGLPHPFGIAFDNGHLFVTTYTVEKIWEFDATTGATISDHFVTAENGSGLNDAIGIAADGLGRLFVANTDPGHVSVYDASTGATINPNLLPAGLPYAVAADRDGVIWVSYSIAGAIGKYDAVSGTAINSSFISGLNYPTYLAIVPEPTGGVLLGIGTLASLARRRRT